MTDYGYPADEFDEPHEDRPRSVHRAPRGWWSRWGAFVVVLVAVPVLAIVAVTWLSDWQPGPGPTSPAVEETDPATGEPPAETDEPAETGTEAEEPPADEPEATPEPQPDLSRPVQVLNATRVAGLAAGGAETLGDAGFTSTSTGNWDGPARSTSVVLYPTPEDAVTAQAAADALGIAAVEQSDTDGIVAVLAEDYAP